MYFKKTDDFILAFYKIYFSSYKGEIIDKISDIYKEYLESNIKNDEVDNLFFELKNNDFKIDIDIEFLKKYNGRVFSIEQLVSKNIKIHHLIKSPYVRKFLPIENNYCKNCGEKKNFFEYKNNLGKIKYCKNCLDFSMNTNIYYKFHIQYNYYKDYSFLTLPKVILSDEQKKASDLLLKNLKNKKTLIWAVCGAGKTEIIYETLYNNLKNNKRVCLAIPRKDIVKELEKRIQKDFNTKINCLCGDYKILNYSSLYIMTTHQLINYLNFFDVIIVDEVDAFPYNGNLCLEYSVKKSGKKEASFIFLSATPSKKIKKNVDNIYKIPIRYHKKLLPVPKLITKENSLKDFIKKIEKSQRRGLIFVPSIEKGENLSKLLNIPFISSKEKERNNIIEQFYKRKIKLLITTSILERGVTFDFLDVFVFEANHKNFTKECLIQISGRVGRKEYDSDGEIFFYSEKKTKNITKAINEIKYMNELAKYRGLNKK